MVRTSASHPINISTLPLANGLLGVTFCPGKKGDSVFGAPWDRDMESDVDAIMAWGADAVLTLIEDHEFEMLSVASLGDVIQSRGMEWYQFPIRDLDVPTEPAMERWRTLSPKLHRIVERGGRILLHCRGGRGRAGMMAALLLIERGREAPAAISEVRSVRPGAIETAEQERWLLHHARHHGLPGLQLHASLIGGAIGDSLGADIEFLSLAEIRRRFPDGITDLPPHQGQRGAITDDTQMTLFTAEGLIRAFVRGSLKGLCYPPTVVHHSLLRWYRTQGGTALIKTDDIGLISDRRMWKRRAPGTTCLSALEKSNRFGALARNNSKGCGTIMRVAPVALMVRRKEVRSTALDTSALTHGHPTGQLAAAAWAEMLADVAGGAPLEDTATSIAAAYERLEGGGETVRAIRAALEAPRDGRAETVEALGGGWTAEEALSIALYACLAGRSFDDSLQIAVLHGGDSDSTGAIAGNMLGLIDPAAALGHRWAGSIEGADIIAGLVRDHLRLEHETDASEQLADAAEQLADAYPGW
ncbi:ADP-ribosylglycohydrolase family protein [Tabrizicola sp. BL-A-41-H6]|uniref:ADP-ribosylglycohydrolase family protein n=1 Tax=Tabrizicola sp. BL-A-41-H6 TaxID=3421107 RepID=UPI003D67FE1E